MTREITIVLKTGQSVTLNVKIGTPDYLIAQTINDAVCVALIKPPSLLFTTKDRYLEYKRKATPSNITSSHNTVLFEINPFEKKRALESKRGNPHEVYSIIEKAKAFSDRTKTSGWTKKYDDDLLLIGAPL
jgi:hypothetical protein